MEQKKVTSLIRFVSYDSITIDTLFDHLHLLRYFRGMQFRLCRLPSTTKRFVVLRSPHVNSKSKEHFQRKQFQGLCLYTVALQKKSDLCSFLSFLYVIKRQCSLSIGSQFNLAEGR